MADMFIKIIVTLVGILGLALGNTSVTPPPITPADAPVPVETVAPVDVEGERYPTYPLWDMPLGLEMDDVEAVMNAQGLYPERDEEYGFLTVEKTEELTVLGYPTSISAYFSDLFVSDGRKTLSSVTFEPLLDSKENDAYLDLPAGSAKELEAAVKEMAVITEETIVQAQSDFSPLTDTRVAVWKSSDSELENVDSPLSMEGVFDAEAYMDILRENQTMLFYATFDNLELMFYAAIDGGEYTFSIDVSYSYFDYSSY